MNRLKVGLAQIAPVLLDREKTSEKMLSYCSRAAAEKCDLIVFSEALLPGYPFWIEHTDGARFNSEIQKQIFSRYYQHSVNISGGDLQPFCDFAGKHKLAMYIGCMEKPAERGTSLYCSLVYISKDGNIGSVHRKLVPTYEERLFWSHGDGNGLKVHHLDDFRVGGLNCWENWMPLARMALYGQGEDLHVSVWPGNVHNTEQIVPFIARENRCYSLAVGGLFGPENVPDDFPEGDKLIKAGRIANGGSCIAAPDGTWVLPPQSGKEDLFTAELDLEIVLRERHNFDLAGHYSRPDVLKLKVNRDRQSSLSGDECST